MVPLKNNALLSKAEEKEKSYDKKKKIEQNRS